MSIIHVNQIATKLRNLFEAKIDLADIGQNDKEADVKFLTRALAAYTIYNYAACSIDDASNSVIDGGDDNGIDAIYYSIPLKELIIVQSKWIKNGSGEPDSGDILKYCQGVEDLMNSFYERFNTKLQSKQSEIENYINGFDTKYTLILAYTGDKGLADHGKRRIDDLVNKLNDAGEGIIESVVKFKKYDQAKIYTTLSKGILSDPINIEVGLHEYGKITEPFGAYYGHIAGEEIAKLWIDYGRKLFHMNIRNVLGKTEVNEELINTIKTSPENFWYFNNGITIIAESIEKSMTGGSKRDFGSFKLNNASIVNGAQTISTIGEQNEKFPESIKRIFVLSRIISLEGTPADFGIEVTKANNRQNRIENRDFVSQDNEQRRIREELAHDGIIYNLMRSDSFATSHKAFDVDEATVCLAIASKNIGLAVQAKRELGKFYENLEKGIYKQLYNPNVTSRFVYNCVLLNRLIEGNITVRINSLAKRSGKEYGILVHGNRMLSFLTANELKIPSNEIANFDTALIKSKFDTVMEKIQIVISKDFADNFLAQLFKNKTKCETLATRIEQTGIQKTLF